MFILLKNKSLNIIITRAVQSSTLQKQCYDDDNTNYLSYLFFHSCFVRSVIRRSFMFGNDEIVNTFEWFDCDGNYHRKNGPSQIFNSNTSLNQFVRLVWYIHGELMCVRAC